MYKLTLVLLFALFSLIFAIPEQVVPVKINKLEKRDVSRRALSNYGTYGTGIPYVPSLVGTNACGIPTNDKQVVVAIPSPIFNNDTDGTHCGETAWVFGRIGSYFYDWIEATVVDYCRGETVNDTRCDSDNSTTIGLSPTLWGFLNDTSVHVNGSADEIYVYWGM
ncbi:hypothetical protein DFH94DRAFT_776936 [Russula ochroleuca]|uniref:Uncharacterized protein n=1 Tax=Russula ochroleuca TaxID=152965 RepID=A0A9P5MNR1_9AGAM|nr:hypothetical protein DFH94DRAFT_776936 [Russula ochroleuca]